MVAKACSYDVQKEGKETIIRFNWLGCPYSPSIEDDPECMSRVIDAIIQVRNVSRIVIAEAYEYEYSKKQTGILAEIAGVLDLLLKEENILTKSKYTSTELDKYAPHRFKFVEDLLLGKLRRDPVAAYLTVLAEVQSYQRKLKSVQFEGARKDYEYFVNEVLLVIQNYLEKTTLIKRVMPLVGKIVPGDRKIYEEIFIPVIRPNFTLTRFMVKPPAKGELIDAYTILGDVNVEIYKIPGKTENYYHIIPPEFQLPEDQYTALGLARRVMVGYKPSSTKFTEQTREYFERVAEDLIGTIAAERKIELTHSQIKALAQILTRYTTGLGIIEIFLADPNLQDLYINAPVGELPIRLLHSKWEECVTNIIPTREDASAMAARFRMESGRPLDEANPVLDTSTIVPGGRARVAIITKNLSPYGLAFAFRRHRINPWTYPLFMENGTMNALSAGLLWFVVDAGRSVLFAGPRSSGKTSVLGATMMQIMKKYRIITVEDTLELPVEDMRTLGFNIVPLKVRSAITKLETEMSAEAGIRTALRLGDSCLIVGEVRSEEARALYEAMRIGALSNFTGGTIHADTPYGLWDRVVNDLKVPSTSFKATDLIVMPAPIRSADGLHRFRRIVNITEVGKDWIDDPKKENGFIELMGYDAKKDQLNASDAFLNGDSPMLMNIGSRVREWAGNWDAIYENIKLRSDVMGAIVDFSRTSNRRDIMEAPFVGKANNYFHIISDDVNQELGAFDNAEIFKRWKTWAKNDIRGKTQKEEIDEGQ